MDLRPGSDYWFGLYKETATRDGTTYWLDGNPSTYREWVSPDPNEATQCVRYTDAGFRDRPCSYEFQYTCKKGAGRYYSHLVYLLRKRLLSTIQ